MTAVEIRKSWFGLARPLVLSLAVAQFMSMVTTPAAAEPKGDVVIAMPQLSQLFDPTAMIGATPHMVYDYIFDGLINLGPEGKYPALAESWTISPDGKQIDFKLRQG